MNAPSTNCARCMQVHLLFLALAVLFLVWLRIFPSSQLSALPPDWKFHFHLQVCRRPPLSVCPCFYQSICHPHVLAKCLLLATLQKTKSVKINGASTSRQVTYTSDRVGNCWLITGGYHHHGADLRMKELFRGHLFTLIWNTSPWTIKIFCCL